MGGKYLKPAVYSDFQAIAVPRKTILTNVIIPKVS